MSSNQRLVDAPTPFWAGFTPDGQRLVVERERDDWVVRCDDSKLVRGHLLDVALIEAVRGNSRADWYGIDPSRYARAVADSILSR